MSRADRVFAATAGLVRALFRPLGAKNHALAQTAVAEALVPVWRQALPGGGDLRFVAPTRSALYRGWTSLTKEPDTIAWIDGFAPGSVLYDVGANIGVFSLYAGMRGHRVIAFEPVAANYAVLNRNIEINALGSRVTAFCAALDRRDGTGALYLESTHAGVSSQFERRLEATRFEQGAISFALDTLLADGRLPFPDHLKIDVDGTEGRILAGAARTLADRRLKSIQIELSPAEGDRDALVRAIEAHGFSGRAGVRANMTFTRG